jgi:hypothetical protein
VRSNGAAGIFASNAALFSIQSEPLLAFNPRDSIGCILLTDHSNDLTGDTPRRIHRHRPRVRQERVFIIVLNWTRRDETIACLASLEKANLRGAHVTVVDNASPDNTVRKLVRAVSPGTFIALKENRGYAAQTNAGHPRRLEKGAEAVVLLNNDTE